MNDNPVQLPKGLVWLIVSIIAAALIFGASVIVGAVILGSKLNQDKHTQELPVVDIKLANDVPVLGNGEARVTVVEYGDFQCPFCGQFFTEILPQLKSEFVNTGKTKFVYQQFPFLGQESLAAAAASLCAKDQNKFWEYHDLLYQNQKGENEGAFSTDRLKVWAKDLGLDSARFNECLDKGEKLPIAQQELKAGETYGVSATPTVFVNGKKFEGVYPYEAYKQEIESSLRPRGWFRKVLDFFR